MITNAEKISGSIQDNWLFLEAWLWGNRQGGRFLLSILYPSYAQKNILFTMNIYYLYNKTIIEGGSAIKEIYTESYESSKTNRQIQTQEFSQLL